MAEVKYWVISAFFVTLILMISYRQRSLIFKSYPLMMMTKEGPATRPTRQEILAKWAEIFQNTSEATRKQRPPDVIGIGVKKCGTGAFIHFIGQHPLVKLPERVETFFFDGSYSRGMDYYQRLMPMAADNQLVMEKTPLYFYEADKVIERIQKNLPQAKLIVSLCDPVKRAFSDFVHGRYGNHKNADPSYFSKAFHEKAKEFVFKYQDPLNDYVTQAQETHRACFKKKSSDCEFAKGIYHYQAREWVKNFDDGHLLVLNGDNWVTDPGGLIEKVQDFLGIPKLLLREDFVKSPKNGFYCLDRWWNETFKKSIQKRGESVQTLDDEELFCLGSGKGRTRNGVRTMLPETYEMLKSFYKPHNELLYKLLSRDMGW